MLWGQCPSTHSCNAYHAVLIEDDFVAVGDANRPRLPIIIRAETATALLVTLLGRPRGGAQLESHDRMT